jgi:PBP1b-binding outer membrane lipoprotein LpoB
MYRKVLILISLLLAGCAGHELDPEKNKTKHRQRKRRRQQPQLMMPSANPLASNQAHQAMSSAARTSTMNTS